MTKDSGMKKEINNAVIYEQDERKKSERENC